jgi:hypothetical protein
MAVVENREVIERSWRTPGWGVGHDLHGHRYRRAGSHSAEVRLMTGGDGSEPRRAKPAAA